MGRGRLRVMYRSVDAGATWEPVESTTTQALQDIAFVDPSNGWAVGGTRVETTVDGGSTWNPRFPPGRSQPAWRGLCDCEHAVCVVGVDNDGPSGCIMRTTDGGANWLQVYTAPTCRATVDRGDVCERGRGLGVGPERQPVSLSQRRCELDAGGLRQHLRPRRDVRRRHRAPGGVPHGPARDSPWSSCARSTAIRRTCSCSTSDGGATWSRLRSGPRAAARFARWPSPARACGSAVSRAR